MSTKISELPAASALAGDELVPSVQSGATVQTTVDDIVARVAAVQGPPGPTGAQGAPGQSYGNALLNGGAIRYVSALQFVVAAASYVINGTMYNSPETTVTLATADATFTRIDVIALTSSSTATKVDGTAAATPAEASIDPLSQLRLTAVTLVANATTIGVTTNTVYDEDDDWTVTTSGASVVKNSTNNPHAGTKCVEYTAAAAGAYANFSNGSAFDLSTRNFLSFYIRNKASWPNAKSVVVQWYNGTTAVGTPVTLKHGAFNFDQTNVSGYQLIGIPTSAFGAYGLTTTAVRFTTTGGGAAIGFHLDDIVLQGGIAVATPTDAMRWKGPYSATVQYIINDVVSYGGRAYLAPGTLFGSAPPTGWVDQMPDAVLTLTDQATIAWDTAQGQMAQVTLTASRIMGAPTNMQNGRSYNLVVIQGGSGSYALTWNSIFKWPGGTVPTGTTTVGGIDIYSFVARSGNLYGVQQAAFA